MKLPTNEKLTIKYIPITEALYWDENPKSHDLDHLSKSIQTYGFLDPGKFESSLNGGQGGIVFGNGRTYVVEYMMKHGFDRPRGIGYDEQGMWYVPVLFGNDIGDENTSKAFALDHNMLGVVGINGITHLDAVRMYEQDDFLQVATGLDMIATSADDIQLMQMLINQQEIELPDEPTEDEDIEGKPKLPSISIKFSSELEQGECRVLLDHLSKIEHGYEQMGDFLVQILHSYANQ